MSAEIAHSSDIGRQPLRLSTHLMTALCCLLIVMLGASMRISGSDWDRGSNLHPDERHMMFVLTDTLTDIKALPPGTLSPMDLWFATGVSPLDPRRDGQLYVYGEFPHLIMTLAAGLTGTDGWPALLRLARTLGAIVDAYTILAVFLLAMPVLRSEAAALAAAAFYAFCPLALQLSNFFAVDVWLTGAAAWATLAATLAVRAPTLRSAWGWMVVAGGIAGLAIACKLPGILVCGVVGGAGLLRFWLDGPRRSFGWLVRSAIGSIAAALLVLRLAAPFTFQGPGFFGLGITPEVIAGYVEMTHLVLDFGFPPSWQWMTGYNAGNAVLDMLLWGLGAVTAAALLVGVVTLVRLRAAWPALVPLLILVVGFGIYWLANPVPALRYAAPVLPSLTVLAGAAVLSVSSGIALLAVVLAFVWGTGMVSLHDGLHSRIAASEWLWQTQPVGTKIARESPWDDGLPSAIRVNEIGDLLHPGVGGHFESVQLNLEIPDTPGKAHHVATQLASADLLAISSERLRKPILALPDRFPMTVVYYGMLASGELCFERVYENKPGYTVLGYRFDDSGVQEPWTVYDHPQVEIYRKLPCYDAQKVETALLKALPNGP